MAQLGKLLQKLEPLEEKTVRLRYGLGCQRPHTVEEIAEAFHTSAGGMARLLEAARHRLTGLGLDAHQLRAAASGPVGGGDNLNESATKGVRGGSPGSHA